MKVTVDPKIPNLTSDEIEEIRDKGIKRSEDHPEEFRGQMLGVQEVIMSEEVARDLAEAGITPDELVAMLLKKSGTSN